MTREWKVARRCGVCPKRADKMNLPPPIVRNASYAALPAPQVADFSLRTDAFLLDIDGTLLDIAASPESVRVPVALKTTLAVLQQSAGGALALVSGRPLSAIDHLFAPLSLAAIGCHGAEWRPRADG